MGPKAVISTCSQVVSIMLSGELSNSSDTPFCVVLKALRIAFQVYLLLEHVGGPEKDQVFVAGQEISKFSLCIFFFANFTSLGMMETHLTWMAHRLESLNKPTK